MAECECGSSSSPQSVAASVTALSQFLQWHMLVGQASVQSSGHWFGAHVFDALSSTNHIAGREDGRLLRRDIGDLFRSGEGS